MAASLPITPSATLRLGAYQGATEPGDTKGNGQRAHAALSEAYSRGVHFACLPEAFLTGYGPPDVLRDAAISVRGRWFREWVRQYDFGAMVSIVGFIERREGQIHNSAAVVQRGKLLGVYTKGLAGSPFEAEAVQFVNRFPVFKAHGITFGVIICVESSIPEPCLLLAEAGARVIFAPHYAYIPMDAVEQHRQRVRGNHIARAVENRCWIVKANTVTEPMRAMGEIAGFGYGESMIVDELGVPRAEAGLFTTGWITADVAHAALTEPRQPRLASLPPDLRRQVANLYLGE